MKDRVTLMLCTNANGDKLPILVIGKAKNPRALVGKTLKSVTYTHQTKAWMTSTIATLWFRTIFGTV